MLPVFGIEGVVPLFSKEDVLPLVSNIMGIIMTRKMRTVDFFRSDLMIYLTDLVVGCISFKHP